MKRNWKRVLALWLSVAMVFTMNFGLGTVATYAGDVLTVTLTAADGVKSDDSGTLKSKFTLTVKNGLNDAEEDDDYKATWTIKKGDKESGADVTDKKVNDDGVGAGTYYAKVTLADGDNEDGNTFKNGDGVTITDIEAELIVTSASMAYLSGGSAWPFSVSCVY